MDRIMSLGLLLFWVLTGACSLFTSNPATNVQLPNVFSDNMVLQRDMKVPIWGTADPGGKVEVVFADHTKKTVVAKDSSWRIELPSMDAGGPYELVIIADDTTRFKNVMVGEVWVCSGQSNMQWPVNRARDAEQEIAQANFPNIRLLQVHRTMSVVPKARLDTDPWQECSPATVPMFSAVGYFFGRELYEHLNIPIGLIHTSWGGTVAEAWTSGSSLKEMPAFADRVIDLETGAQSEEKLSEEYRKKVGLWLSQIQQKVAELHGSQETLRRVMSDAGNWQQMKLPVRWEKAGLPGYDGEVWFKRTVKIPSSWAGKALTLHLGPIDDIDYTFFNDVKVGSTGEYNIPRHYSIAPDLVKPGENVIAVQVIDTGGNGGLWGSPQDMRLESETGESIFLAGNWSYLKGIELKDLPRRPVSPTSPNRPTVLYNAMIHPIIPFAIRGAIWYQGESNAGRAYQYRSLFPAMIRDWRAHWKQGDFPFYFVQLANFRAVKPEPEEDTWAELREAQLMTLSEPNTGMAVIIDIGEADNIHPKNKQDVGKRLALIARHNIYGEDVVYSGPIYKSMTVEASKVRLKFDHVDGGLMTRDDEKLVGFAIAGADKKFYWADATIDGETVVVSSPLVAEPVAVRYAWAINPVCNLYNKAGLPASPFRTDNWSGLTVGVE